MVVLAVEEPPLVIIITVVVVVAESEIPTVQALVRWDPVGHARAQLDERIEVGFPPAVHVAAVDGSSAAIAALVEEAFWIACPNDPDDFDAVESRLVRTDKADPASNEEAVAQWCLTVKDSDEHKVGRGIFSAMTELALASIPGFFAVKSSGSARPFGVHRAGLVPADLVPQHVVVLGGDRSAGSGQAPPRRSEVMSTSPSSGAGPLRSVPECSVPECSVPECSVPECSVPE